MNEKPEALRLADELASMWAKDPVVAELRRLHAENEALTATRDRQASMLRRLEEREAELDAEIGHLRRENERLREALEMVRDADDDCKRDGLPTIPFSARAFIDAALRREDV